MYTTNTQQSPKYYLEVSYIHLRSSKIFPTLEYPIIMEVVDTLVIPLLEVILPNINLPTDVSSKTTNHTILNPPFPHKLDKEKSIPQKEETFDIIEQLKNMHVQIPLFQVIKDVPLYGKAIKEAYLKKLGQEQKDPQTVHIAR